METYSTPYICATHLFLFEEITDNKSKIDKPGDDPEDNDGGSMVKPESTTAE